MSSMSITVSDTILDRYRRVRASADVAYASGLASVPLLVATAVNPIVAGVIGSLCFVLFAALQGWIYRLRPWPNRQGFGKSQCTATNWPKCSA